MISLAISDLAALQLSVALMCSGVLHLLAAVVWGDRRPPTLRP